MFYALRQAIKNIIEGRSSHWPAVQKAFLAGHPTCEACGGTKNLQAHHRIPFSFDPTRELDLSNLQALCEDPKRLCHLRVGHSWNFSGYNPHSVADAATELNRIKNRVQKKESIAP